MRELVMDSIANFHLGQTELVWTAAAYALYLPPARKWKNRFGERFSFDDLALELMKRSPLNSSCGGTHLLLSQAILLRVHDASPVLSTEVERRLRSQLATRTATIIRIQEAGGYWHSDWNRSIVENGESAGWTPIDSRYAQLLVTGHLMEYLLILPNDIAVPDETLRRGGLWLFTRLRESTPAERSKELCPYSHAASVVRRLMFVPSQSKVDA